jgi:hypothetical protein
MSKKKSQIWKEIIGYKPFKTTMPKPKKPKPKPKKRWRLGDIYDPTPKDFGKQYDPMEKFVAEAFYKAFKRIANENN